MDANSTLSQKPPLFRFPVFVIAGVCIAFALLAIGFVLIVVFYLRRSKSGQEKEEQSSTCQPLEKISCEVTKEIQRIKDNDGKNGVGAVRGDTEESRKNLEAGKVKGELSSGGRSSVVSSSGEVDMANIGWGRWYSLAELDAATGGFAIGNVIGEGGYGIVYRGVLPDCSVVAVKKLLNNKGQADKEFRVEVEAIGKVRHKNLVGLIGYCVEDTQRMLVYEYVDNGNLEQWLHGDVGPVSPLTWDIRMRIAIGTAKGIAYLHEGLEPKVVHRDIKSSNILLDQQWNAKVSDFGLAKLLGSDSNFVTTRVMGTFGYVAPDYASTGKLNEASDVYSFGVLLMEIISGRNPVDYRRPAGEVNLVEWFKMVVGNRRAEEVVDPLIEVQPVARALKRVLLICLRCIDPDVRNRPKMGQVVHMLEGDDFPFRTPRAVPINARGADATASTKDSSLLTTGKLESGAHEKSMWR